MAKDFITFDRKIKILLDINTNSRSVPFLANRYNVSENTIYEYIKWFKLRFDVQEVSDSYSVELSEEETKAYKRFISPRNGRTPFDWTSLIPFYSQIKFNTQSYSYRDYTSIFNEFYQE